MRRRRKRTCAAAACGHGSTAPTTPPAPDAPRAAPNTPSPAEVPARTSIQVPTPAVAASAPTPMPTNTPAPTSEPTSTPEPISAGAAEGLAAGCINDGSLTNAELIVACSEEAMRRIQAIMVKVRVDLGGMFMGMGAPNTAEPAPVVEMEIARVMPDDMNGVVKNPDGGEIRVIMTGGDGYINDPVSGDWIKVEEIPAEISEMFLMASTFEGQFLDQGSGPVEWDEVSLSEDGAKYMLSFRLADAEAAMFGPTPEFRITLDATTFLHDSMYMVAVGADGVEHKILEIEYSQHNEPFEIEAPAEYIEVGSMSPFGGGMSGSAPGQSEGAELIGFHKNADGDVEMQFSGPVTVSGKIALYVFDLALGEADGWEIPMIGGSGTDTLTFDAQPEGKPSLTAGEGAVAGIVYKSADADILDSNGDPITIYFEEWIYP